MKKTKLEFKLPVSVIKEDKRYIAYTPALDLSTSGKSYNEAKKRFEEIVNIFFEEIIKKGTLEKVLHDLGWKQIKTKWSPPAIISHNFQEVQIST